MVTVVFIAGPAGTGKSTLGDALAVSLGGVHLDFDVVSEDVVDRARATHPGITEAELLLTVKDARYEVLHSALVAHLVQRPDTPVVVSAPFSRQITSAEAWRPWADVAPDSLLVWLDLDEAERARRIATRGATRDTGSPRTPAPRPGVPHLALDAAEPTAALVEAVRGAALGG